MEVSTIDTKYLVKISTKLERSMANFDDADATVLNTESMDRPPDADFESNSEEE